MSDECLPPPEMQNQKFHWLQQGKHIEPARWMIFGYWEVLGWRVLKDPRSIHKEGWRYVGPCKPPEKSDG